MAEFISSQAPTLMIWCFLFRFQVLVFQSWIAMTGRSYHSTFSICSTESTRVINGTNDGNRIGPAWGSLEGWNAVLWAVLKTFLRILPQPCEVISGAVRAALEEDPQVDTPLTELGAQSQIQRMSLDVTCICVWKNLAIFSPSWFLKIFWV